MIEVHHLNNSRSQRVLWLLEEIGAPYTIVPYQRDPQTMLAPPSLKAIHPLGKSPVVRDGNHTIAESGAILEYLAERYGQDWIPPRDGGSYEKHRYWMHYAEGSLMPQLLLKLYLGRVGEAARPVLERVEKQIGMHLDFVASELGESQFLTGSAITIADVQMSFPLELASVQKLLTQPNLQALVHRWHARPAYQRAMAKGGPYAYGKD